MSARPRKIPQRLLSHPPTAPSELLPIPTTQAERDAQANWPKLIRHLAWKVGRWGFDWIPRDERLSLAGMACANANDKYDPARCPSGTFRGYLRWAAVCHMTRVLRTWLRSHERNRFYYLDHFAEKYSSGDHGKHADPFGPYANMPGLVTQPAEIVEYPHWWYWLSGQERHVVMRRAQGATLKVIAGEIGKSTQRVDQIVAMARKRLKRRGVSATNRTEGTE